MCDWPLVIDMLVYELHVLKPTDILLYIKNARAPAHWCHGPRVGVIWSRRFRGNVPGEARVPNVVILWVTLWEAVQVGADAGRFTVLQ